MELAEAQPVLRRIAALRWGDVWHAYGPAADVPAQLAAITLGDDATRESAWWELWGNIHHQGTIYEATVPSVPILGDLAAWTGYPDRAQATVFLREVAAATTVVVWRYGRGREIVRDEDAGARLADELRRQMNEVARGLLSSWRDEPEDVQRALVYFLTALPDEREHWMDLVTQVLPPRFRDAWGDAFSESASPMTDEIDALESWVHSGDRKV